MYTLRYYSPDSRKEVHEAILVLLSALRVKFGIETSIVQIRIVPSAWPGHFSPDDTHEKELYESDFRPRRFILKARTGYSIANGLRSRSGNYYVAGTLAVVSRHGVEWYARRDNHFPEYADDPVLGFLKALLERGPELISKFCGPVPTKGNPEQGLVEEFLASETLPGKVLQQVKVGANKLDVFDWRKAADIVIDRGEVHWVIEAKVRLDYGAFGQILTYAPLYASSNPSKIIRMAIVCIQIDGELVAACNDHGISVFQRVENAAFRVLGPAIDLRPQ